MTKWLLGITALVIVIQLAGMAKDKRMARWIPIVLPAVSGCPDALGNRLVFYETTTKESQGSCPDLANVAATDIWADTHFVNISTGYDESLLKMTYALHRVEWQAMYYASSRNCIGSEHHDDCWGFPEIAKINFNSGWKNRRHSRRVNDFHVREYIGSLRGSNILSSFQGSLSGFTSNLSGLVHLFQLPYENYNLHSSYNDKYRGNMCQILGERGQLLGLISDFFISLKRFSLYLYLYLLISVGCICSGITYYGAQFIDRGRKFVGFGLCSLALLILLSDLGAAGFGSPIAFWCGWW